MIKSDEIRNSLKKFDSFLNKVSKTAILKDSEFTYSTVSEFEQDFHEAVKMMADYFGVDISELNKVYSEEEFDCDDFAGDTVAMMKRIRRKRSMQDGKIRKARPVFPVALEENHTIIAEIIDGKLHYGDSQIDYIYDENQKLNVVFVG